jgi:hypothetical protein
MRKSPAFIIASAAVAAFGAGLASSATAVPPDGARPESASVQFGAFGAIPDPAIEDKIYRDATNTNPLNLQLDNPVGITAGGAVTFNVNGAHQPLVYRLRDGETRADAIARLDQRAAETDAAGRARRRMAGQDQFVAPTVAAPDALTDEDRDFGFRYLSEVKPPSLAPATSPPLGEGQYVLLCNVRVHYATFDMYGALDASPNQPPA